MKQRHQKLYVAAALLATLCWGGGMTLTKLALVHIDPSPLLVIQLLSSIAFLVCMAPLLRVRLLPPRSASKRWWLGILEPGLAYFLGLEGLKRISASEAVVLSATESILVIALACLFAKERPRGLVYVLAVIGAAGAVVVAGGRSSLHGQVLYIAGDALLVGGVLCAAAYVVLSSHFSSVTEPLSALIGQQGAAAVFAVAMYILLGEHALPTRDITAAGWALAVVSGIVQYGCAFWFYLWALKGLSASVAGLFLNLIPVFGLLIAMPVLGDTLTPLQWLGAAMIIGSVSVLALVGDGHKENVPAKPAPESESPTDAGRPIVGPIVLATDRPSSSR
ncbi:MAG: DMT family transporter [Steroidobacteraceae bacterium]|jgi:drug/metabolite transporter (DMT)-like permease